MSFWRGFYEIKLVSAIHSLYCIQLHFFQNASCLWKPCYLSFIVHFLNDKYCVHLTKSVLSSPEFSNPVLDDILNLCCLVCVVGFTWHLLFLLLLLIIVISIVIIISSSSCFNNNNNEICKVLLLIIVTKLIMVKKNGKVLHGIATVKRYIMTRVG